MNFKRIMIVLVVVALASSASFAANFETRFIVRQDNMEVPTPALVTAEADDAQVCCDDGVFGFADTSCDGIPLDIDGVASLELNSFWTETVTAADCADWEVLFTAGVKPGASAIVFFNDEPISFGDLCEFVDLELVFCIGYTIVPPDLTFSPPFALPYSYGVTTPDGSVPVPALIGTVDVE